MKYFITVCLVTFAFSLKSFSQEKSITHKVEKGETITQIAQKYNVTPYDIYQLNPDAQSGLRLNTVLLIPNKNSKSKLASQTQTHKVWPKETLFSIEKQYGVSDEALKKANPFLEKDGLQIGQTLTIPTAIAAKVNATKAFATIQEKVVYHEVLPKETKYSIAKQYGITIQELEQRNPEIIPNLTIGYKLLIKGTPVKVAAVVSQKEIVKPFIPKINYITYVVKPKETLFSLSKMSGLSQDELVLLNPALSNGVEIGMEIKVPENSSISQETNKTIATLTNHSNSGTRKKIALLLPFNLSLIESDSTNSTTSRLKNDKFLNMTLDFYSGALIAIDSAKALGLPIDFAIFDSKETKYTSDIANINQQNNLETADAIIGPFYQNNLETTAQLVSNKNVPVISPLSKDIGNPYSNLYQTIPTVENLKNAIFNYMSAKRGNMIAVVDKKRESSKQYLEQNHAEVKIVPLSDKGTFTAENLKSLFVKGKTNYVILETGNTVMVKATINAMVSAMPDYDVQLVILENNETLETDEIKFENLVKLKLLYPSINRENDSDAAVVFDNEYRKQNKVFPNTYATRGFDVTFDTMMRLFQEKSFQDCANTYITEQVDNKFEYSKKETGGFTNKGIYILNYDSDLTIKEAN
jgi:LysM repeat protein